MLAFAALDRAAAYNLASVQERARLCVVELQRGLALQMPAFVQALNDDLADELVNFAAVAKPAAFVDIKRDVVGIERLFLQVVVALHVVGDIAFEFPCFHQLAVAFVDRRPEAVGPADKAHVLCANPVAKEARETVCRHKDAAHMPEMKRLVTVGHTRGDDRPFRPSDSVVRQCSHP